MAKLAEVRRILAGRITAPVARLLAGTPVTPGMLTWLGFLLNAGAAVLIITGNLIAGGVMVLVGSVFDLFDGALARLTGRDNRFGAALDSTLDRFSDAVLLLGVLVFYARASSIVGVILAGVALSGSMLVSYIRARAEALGLECRVGLCTRAERVILLALGLLLSRVDNALIIVLALMAGLSLFTAVQRLVYVWKHIEDA